MTPVYGQMPSLEFTRALHVAIQCGWPPRIIAREPDSGSGSRDLHAGQGVRPHGRRGACGLMFVMVGSETTTSPRVVMPNRYCWALVASNATRSGPLKLVAIDTTCTPVLLMKSLTCTPGDIPKS